MLDFCLLQYLLSSDSKVMTLHKVSSLHIGPILESNSMCAIFQNKGKTMLKKGKYLKIWAKMYKI